MPKPIGPMQLSLPMFEPSEDITSPPLTFSLEDSHARMSRLPENALAYQKAHDLVYGLNSRVLLAIFDPALSFWRTSQEFLPGTEASLLLTLPKWGMWDTGALYELRIPAHRTNVSAGSAWPTPVASDADKGAIIGANDTYYTTSTGMPRKVNRNGKDGSVGLGRLVQLGWATPNAADAVGTHGGGQGRSLRTDTHGMGGSLNADWVEMLMGYPQGWTDISSPLDLGNLSSKTNRRAYRRIRIIAPNALKLWGMP